MRVAMLTWEYPPLVVGGIAAHTEGLSRALVRAGHEVVVLTLHHPDAPLDGDWDGVRVLRAHHDIPWLPEDQFVARMASANHHLVSLVQHLDGWTPHLVHAHDWLVAWAGSTLKDLWNVPLAATVHATERGRSGGHIPPGQPTAINSVEWWLTFQAGRVITCSEFMRNEVLDAFRVPEAKLDVVPNGVDPEPWRPPPGVVRTAPPEPLIVAWGRVQYEKGFHTLLAALPEVRWAVPGVRVVIAGRGGYLGELRHLAQRYGVDDIVDFPGFVPDDELKHLLHRAAVAVIPSLYEPFGIVALEAMAAGAPLVAAATGGMAEIIEGTGAGLLFPPGDAGALAGALRRVLADPVGVATMQDTANELLATEYTWDVIAAQTVEVYDRLLADRASATK